MATTDQRVLDLSFAGVNQLTPLLDSKDLGDTLNTLSKSNLPTVDLSRARILSPIENQEVWAAGVTYLRSMDARKEESSFSAQAYEHVYSASRPEIFFKSVGEKVAGPGDHAGIRSDAKWQVPEPELALIMNSRGQWIGVSIGNDMSARDIEGENLLYLPQAKIFNHSCIIGPSILVGMTEPQIRQWTIHMEIHRSGQSVFAGTCGLDRLKRPFSELIAHLWHCQRFPHGVVLLTGTGIIPPNDFTLHPGDIIRMEIPEIGLLENTTAVV